MNWKQMTKNIIMELLETECDCFNIGCSHQSGFFEETKNLSDQIIWIYI